MAAAAAVAINPPLVDKNTTIATSMMQLVGQTPMVYLTRLNTTGARVAIKLESENPMASVKDRLALGILLGAQRDGLITPGKTTLVEATSGNTGIALAQMAAILGYKIILVMPETMSIERRCLLSVLGATVHLTPAALGMKGAVSYAEKIARDIPDAYVTSQFETKYNAQIHYETTGPEIWKQTAGEIDYFVSGVGTGGTLTGVARYLKEQKPAVKIIAVEPEESPVLSGGKHGPHKIQGIGAGFIPGVLDQSLISEVLRVSSDQAIAVARRLPTEEGIFAGISSGASIAASLELAARPENAGKLIVAILPSFGERYLSTVAFQAVREQVAAWPVVPADVIFPPAASSL